MLLSRRDNVRLDGGILSRFEMLVRRLSRLFVVVVVDRDTNITYKNVGVESKRVQTD